MGLVNTDKFKKWMLENSINNREIEESKQIGIWLDTFESMQNEQSDCGDCIKHGGDWECDRVHCHKGDAISRQAAIDNLMEILDRPNHAEFLYTDEICGVLWNLPSVQPERKRGKWRRRLVDSGFNADWHCSECGWKTSIEEHGYNFCPNCGCRMEEGE